MYSAVIVVAGCSQCQATPAQGMQTISSFKQAKYNKVTCESRSYGPKNALVIQCRIHASCVISAPFTRKCAAHLDAIRVDKIYQIVPMEIFCPYLNQK